MTYKTILVPLGGCDNDPVALRAAMAVARDFDAHVLGLFVSLDPRDAVPMLGEGMSGAMVDEIMRAAEGESNNHRVIAHRHFDDAVREAGVELRDVPNAVEAPSAAWREVVGRIEDVVPAEGRLADLIVFAHTTLDADTQGYATMETALLGTGRPLLLVPKTLPATIGRTVAVAWNGKIEASRALAAALPFLRSADRVHALTAENSGDRRCGRTSHSRIHGLAGRQRRVDNIEAWIGTRRRDGHQKGRGTRRRSPCYGRVRAQPDAGNDPGRCYTLCAQSRRVAGADGPLDRQGAPSRAGLAAALPLPVGGPLATGTRPFWEERAMLTIKDCIALSDLTEAQIDAIAEHEHVPEMVAAELGCCLAHTPGGDAVIVHILADDIAEARAHGRVAHAAELVEALTDFVATHPVG